MPSFPSLAVLLALVVVTTSDHLFTTSAFSTPGKQQQQHYRLTHVLFKKPNDYHLRLLFHPTSSSSINNKTRRFIAHQQEHQTQEDFQRSLLEAKIANDIKNTIIKDEQQRNIIVSSSIAQERVELQDAVNEVKEAVQDISASAITLGVSVIGPESVMDAAVGVSKSAINLGGAFVTTVPKIFTRLVTLCATSETR
jgi:isopropylmalate/homocitrate/citramalate synthase